MKCGSGRQVSTCQPRVKSVAQHLVETLHAFLPIRQKIPDQDQAAAELISRACDAAEPRIVRTGGLFLRVFVGVVRRPRNRPLPPRDLRPLRRFFVFAVIIDIVDRGKISPAPKTANPSSVGGAHWSSKMVGADADQSQWATDRAG